MLLSVGTHLRVLDDRAKVERFIEKMKVLYCRYKNYNRIWSHCRFNPGGRAGVVQDTRNAHQLFSDINLTTDNMRTFVRKDGLTATLWWGMWSGTGKFTKNKSTAPVHAYFYWKDDKIVSGGRFFDPTVLKEEFAASQKK